jgi:hypothetical protein
MNVYDIETGYSYSQIHCVVAENMGEAERIFKAKYWPTEIKSISLHSVYVQIQKYDEQKKEN